MNSTTASLVSRDALASAFQKCREQLLAERNAAGHWEGELSTSALSTATAVMALHQVHSRGCSPARQHHLQPLIEQGLRWLREHRNPDGGWGDTLLSISNISTTMLVKAAMMATATQAGANSAEIQTYLAATDRYITEQGGTAAVIARYGRDQTFSVPILMQCALGGLADWSDVSQLPFEMACLPADWYKWAQMPVVSYALPALITIGLVRHRQRPTWFLPWRWLRNACTPIALRVLTRIQPTTGGFLEATPLTSFVTMSLVAAGEGEHPVVKQAVRFLCDSVRPDGSWPIDTNLATWVTTLSLQALGPQLPAHELPAVRDWLLGQQYQVKHPYTNADPGGWAWTDLPGGVPDADDTPGAILAILAAAKQSPEAIGQQCEQAAGRGIHWLLNLQNQDGGWPTFCRGWGKLPFDRSSPDITAHVLRAFTAYMRQANLSETERLRCLSAWDRGEAFLLRRQREDGAWLPLWFGNQAAQDDENPTYGTAKVLLAFLAHPAAEHRPANQQAIDQGVRFLESIQNADGGWGGAAKTPSSVEETALAVESLLRCGGETPAVERGLNWLIERVQAGTISQPAPIGFYFAKLWYYERLYPLIFATGTLRLAEEARI